MSDHHAVHHHSGHGNGDSGSSQSSSELAGFLAGLTPRPQRALDLGCGAGADAVFLAEQGIETIGLDSNEHAIARARQRAEQLDVAVTWVMGDVLQLPFDDASFDLVLDRGCLHHVAPADQARYAQEVARVLRPGGTLLIREMNDARHALAVTDTSLRDMIDGLPLDLRSITTYRGRDEHHPRTMLAVFDRR